MSQISKKPLKVVKICCIGSSGAGKTCLMKRYTEDKVENEVDNCLKVTVGCGFFLKKLDFENHCLRLNVWDTVGQEYYKSLTRQYYRGASVFIIVYDITKEKQFDETKAWVLDVGKYADSPNDIVIAIVGNKRDKEGFRAVSKHKGQLYADSIGAVFMETSALTGYHVDLLFQEIVKRLPNNTIPNYPVETCKRLDKKPVSRKRCCK